MALVPRRIVVSRSVPVVASAPAGKCRVISSKAARLIVCRASSTSTNAAAGPRIDPATVEKLPSHAWWPERLAKLQASDAVSVVGPQEAYDMYKEGKAKIVDVRGEVDFEESRIEGSENLPYLIADKNKARWFVGMMLCTKGGFKGRNDDFVAQFEQRFPDKKAPVLVACRRGGELGGTPVTRGDDGRLVYPEGATSYVDPTQSQSLYACYELMQAGYEDLRIIDGGIVGWFYDELPYEDNPFDFKFHPTILPGIVFQLVVVEFAVVQANLKFASQHPEYGVPIYYKWMDAISAMLSGGGGGGGGGM
ncbi:rhodanese domain-containing protein [Pseudoscourfieldia marina]